MAYLHQRGVKGFVTVNVLVFDEELSAVEEHVRHIAACGADAVIVQARTHSALTQTPASACECKAGSSPHVTRGPTLLTCLGSALLADDLTGCWGCARPGTAAAHDPVVSLQAQN